MFANQSKRTAFEFNDTDGTWSADILRVDARFISLIKWLGDNRIPIRLSGQNMEDGYAVYKIRRLHMAVRQSCPPKMGSCSS